MQSSHCCRPSPKQEKVYSRLYESLDRLIRDGNAVHYRKGQVIFYEGHHPCGFYLLKEGRVSLKESTAGSRPKMHPTEDKLLGLVHLLSETPYCSACTAEEDVDIIFVPKTIVLQYLDENK